MWELSKSMRNHKFRELITLATNGPDHKKCGAERLGKRLRSESGLAVRWPHLKNSLIYTEVNYDQLIIVSASENKNLIIYSIKIWSESEIIESGLVQEFIEFRAKNGITFQLWKNERNL